MLGHLDISLKHQNNNWDHIPKMFLLLHFVCLYQQIQVIQLRLTIILSFSLFPSGSQIPFKIMLSSRDYGCYFEIGSLGCNGISRSNCHQPNVEGKKAACCFKEIWQIKIKSKSPTFSCQKETRGHRNLRVQNYCASRDGEKKSRLAWTAWESDYSRLKRRYVSTNRALRGLKQFGEEAIFFKKISPPLPS